MPAAVNSLRSSYRRLEDDRRVTARSINTVSIANIADTAAAATTAAAAGDITCSDDYDIRCPRTTGDASRVMIKTQVSHSRAGNCQELYNSVLK